MLSWIKSYLTNRLQFVEVLNCQSRYRLDGLLNCNSINWLPFLLYLKKESFSLVCKQNKVILIQDLEKAPKCVKWPYFLGVVTLIDIDIEKSCRSAVLKQDSGMLDIMDGQ